MFRCILKKTVLAITLVIIGFIATAQKVTEPSNVPSEWSKPYPAFQIAGNLYYVGTYDLASYLITTPQGHILINTGLAASVSLIKVGVESLGFKFKDIRILLTTQAHYDHMGAMAEIQRVTGAQMMVDSGDSSVVADGGRSDYAIGSSESTYEPVKIDRVLHDEDTISLGGMRLTMLHHPGHTKGSCSYLFDVKDKRKSYRVLIANMPTIVTEKSFSDIPAYPGIAKDYEYTLNALKRQSFDIWLSSHASQFGLHTKHKPGDKYNPAAFVDRKGYDTMINDLKNEFLKKVKRPSL
ncbi:MAG: subclass B3 metallo-beta-lactamase [Chitinophagaceae bacterium]